ncbi:MAG TPA: 4-alpha-glucanotransferase [Ktedonobacterales bacterium]|nr:4-alpha-glucanotransferase [Ktedonobacterales bacterium]
MKWPRAAGILLHPSSLPGPYGIGDLGPAALQFLDQLAASGMKLWQVLPLGPTGYGNSPYALVSAFAGNPLLVSPDRLVEDGLLTPTDIAATPAESTRRVNFARVVPWKSELLRLAHRRYLGGAARALRPEFEAFRATHRAWLDEYTLYTALKSAHDGAAWVEWDSALSRRAPAALASANARLRDERDYHAFAQFLFFRQWAALRRAAGERGVHIIGDLAIFVAHDSVDVWANPELFRLDERGWPEVVAGVPPDYFSATGQRWGNPLYHWDTLKQTGYAWWIDRVRQALALNDYIRLDHFRGFHAYWEVPASCPTAAEGRWARGPGDELFHAIRAALGDVPFIAEDLGVITPGVRALRRRLRFPGMKVMQFGFSGDSGNIHLPHHYTLETIVYTGTHDNDTTRAWFASLSECERSRALEYLDCAPRDLVWKMIRSALASVANLAVIPLQDALELGSEGRMNQPSRPDGNWEWRLRDGEFSPAIVERLATYTSLYGR